MSQDPIAIGYLPWADIQDEFSVGRVSSWPYNAKASEKITDARIREHLCRFFDTFVDNCGKPVQTVVACSVGDINFRKFTAEESDAINSAVDCLIFATVACGTKNGVCADNRSMAPPSADRFDLCARWIWPTEDGLVVKTDNSMSYWAHGQYKITQPISLGGIFLGDYQPLLEGLGRTLIDVFPDDVRQRLLRTIEWFRFAHTESTAVSWQQKIVMMATAFEILLEFPRNGKKAHFIQTIDSRMRLNESFLLDSDYEKGKVCQICMAAEWAAQFYDLRSRIVHGDPVNAGDALYKDWFTHLIVADLVLLELIMRLLYDHRCIGDDLRERITAWAQDSDDSVEDLERGLLAGTIGLGLEDVHEALGWIPPLDERRLRAEERLRRDLPESSDCS